MNNNGEPKRLHPIAAAGFIALVVGIVAAIWLHDGRWIALGAGALLVGAAIAATLDRKGQS